MTESLKHLNRYSTPARALTEPAPDDMQLQHILQAAMSAPDHGRLYPYRFITIRENARYKLSDLFGRALLQRDPEVDVNYLQKQKDKPLRSPLIVVVVATPIKSEKIPEIEQILSAGAAAHNVLLGANALGYGSIWLTGANAYDPLVCSELGLADSERIIGFIYIGTPQLEIPPRKLPNVTDYLSNWK